MSFTYRRISVKGILVFRFVLVLFAFSLTNCKRDKTENQESTTQVMSCHDFSDAATAEAIEGGFFKAKKSNVPVKIDGCSLDKIWSSVNWYDMNYTWMGKEVTSKDYNGKFKLAWDSQYLYVLVEVVDDYLNPTLSNGVENYWKGDYVEVFIDEDKSGGDHKFNHQAFAYHVSTEGHSIDKSTLKETVFFEDHITVVRSQDGDSYLWEMAIKLFDNEFDESSKTNLPVIISAQKTIGFSIAYGDNDGKDTRENFMGSKKTHGNNNDDGYINSDVFGSILFVN